MTKRKNRFIHFRNGTYGDEMEDGIDGLEYAILGPPHWTPFRSKKYGLVWSGRAGRDCHEKSHYYAKVYDVPDDLQMAIWDEIKRVPQKHRQIPAWARDPMLAAIKVAQYKQKKALKCKIKKMPGLPSEQSKP